MYGYDFDPKMMPPHDASPTNWKEYEPNYNSNILTINLFDNKSIWLDLGEDIIRFQIPIITNDDVWLCNTDYDVIPEDIRLLYEKDGLNDGSNLWTHEVFDDKNENEFSKFRKRFDGHFQCYRLPPGVMYHFDTSTIHTLFNGGSTRKISLLIDVKINDWVVKFLEGFRDF